MGEYWRKSVIFSTFLLVSVGAQQFLPPGLHAPVQGRQPTRGNDGRNYFTSPEDIHVEFFQTAASQHQLGGRMDSDRPINHPSISPSSSVDSATEHLPEASEIRPVGTGSLQLAIPFMTHHHQQSYPVTFESYPVSNFVFQAQAPAQFQPTATATNAPATPTTQRPKPKTRKLKKNKTRLTKEEKAQRGVVGSGSQRTTVDYKEHSPSDLKVFSIPIDALEDEDLYYDDEQEEDVSEEGGVEAGEGADQEEDMEKVRQTISSLNENTRARSKAKSSSAGRRGNGKPKAAAKPTLSEDEEEDGADVNGEDDVEATGDVSESSGGSGYQQTPKAKSSGGRKSGGGNGSSRERTSGSSSSSKPKNKNRSKSTKGQVVSTLRVEITGARKAINKGNGFQTAPSGAPAPAPASKVEGAGGSFSSGQNGGYEGAGENAGGSSVGAKGPTQAEQDYILGKFIPALLDYQRQNNGNQVGGAISQSGPGQQIVQQGASGKFSSGQAGNGAAQQSGFFNNNPSGQPGQAQFFSGQQQGQIVSGNPAQPQVSYGSPQPAAPGQQQVSSGFPQQNQFINSVSAQSISAQPQVQSVSGQSGISQSAGAPQISYGSPQSLNQYLTSTGQRQVLSSSPHGQFSSGQTAGQTVSNTPSVSYGFPQAPQFIQARPQGQTVSAFGSGSGQQQVSSGQTAGQIFSNSPSTAYGSPQQQSQIEIVQAISQDQLFSTFSSNSAAPQVQFAQARPQGPSVSTFSTGQSTGSGQGSSGQSVSGSPSIAYGSPQPQVQFVQARPQGSSVSAFSAGQSSASGQGSSGQSVPSASPSIAYGSPQVQFVQARPQGSSVSAFSTGQSSASGQGSSGQSVSSGSPSIAYGSPQVQFVQARPQGLSVVSGFSTGQSSGSGQGSSAQSQSPSIAYGSPQTQFVQFSPQGPSASAFSSGQFSSGPGQASSGGQSSGSPSISYGSPQQIQFVSAGPQGQIASAFSSGQISSGSPQIIQSFPTAQPSAIPSIFRVTAQPVLPRVPALTGGSGFGFSNPSTPRPIQVTAVSPTLQSYSAGSQASLGRFNTGSSSGSSSGSSGGSTGSQEFFKSAIFVPTSSSSSESDSGSGSSSFSTATNGIIQGISNLFSRFASSASPTAASPTPSAVTPTSSPQNTVQTPRSQFALTPASGIQVGNNGNSGHLSPSQSTAAPVPPQQFSFASQGSTPASYTGGFIAPVALSASSASSIPSSGAFSQQYNTFSSNALNAKTNAFITPSVATAANAFGPIGGTSFSSGGSGFSSGSSNSGFSSVTPRPFFSTGSGSSSSLPIQISPSQASAMLKDELSLPNDPAQRQELRNALQLVTRFAVSQIAVPNESSASGAAGRQINGFSPSSVSGGYPNYIQKRKDDDESETIPIDTDADSVSFDAFAEQVYNDPETHIPNHPSPLIPADASADITVHA